MLLPCGSASGAVTQTVLKKTRGTAFRAGVEGQYALNNGGIAITKEEAGRKQPWLSVAMADKYDTPNGVSPCKGNHPTKRGEKRKSPS